MGGNRNRVLLLVALALAVLRFGVVPWVASQAEAHERLEVLTRRLDRSVGVVQNREAILEAQRDLRARTASLGERFPLVTNASGYRLESQQRIGALVAESGAKLALFDWVLDGRLPEAGLAFGRVRLQIEGPLRDVARAHAALEGGLPSLVVREANLNAMAPARAADETAATLTLVGDLLFRAPPGPAVKPAAAGGGAAGGAP
jgi:hypothetical protein